jgi:putative chitinase
LIAAFDPNTTKWLQGALNTLLALNPPLAVDGQYGPKTKAAVEQMQAKLGLVVDGLAGKLTQAAIDAALAKLPVIK